MAEFFGKKIVILGLARQGSALARFAVNSGADVTISDLRTEEQLKASIEELNGLGIKYVLGDHPMSLLKGTEILAISGGVSTDMPLVQAARSQGILISNDSQEFIQRCPAPCIGITGSAGKTTTTALTGAMGTASGRKTWIGGNIGRPLIADLDNIQPNDLVVQELSSFQLEIWQHSPPVAAILNITPNHLDRHKTMALYSDAKANILRNQSSENIAILAADDPGAAALAPLARGRLRFFSIEHPVNDGAFIADGIIWLKRSSGSEISVCPVTDIQLRGRHNQLNVCAAVTIADSVNISTGAIGEAIRNFHGVEHRLELVATINGVQFINDSIATAPERSLAAIDSFEEPLILLAGGQDKDMVWEQWAQRIQERIKIIILFGKLAPILAEKIKAAQTAGSKSVEMFLSQNLAEALEIAVDLASPGDVVLLSPGGTSYDAYKDFAERGEEFRFLIGQKVHAEDPQIRRP